MGKSILYRLFGLGKLPRDVKSGLENEEIEFLDEGIRSSVTFKKFKAPGKRFYWRRNWFPGSFVVTNKRVAGFAYSKSLIDVTFGSPLFEKLHIEATNPRCIFVRFEASDFHADRRGTIECRFKTEKALFAVALLESKK